MSELQIHIPCDQPKLENAIRQFVQDEFEQSVSFRHEPVNTVHHKDSGLLDVLWQTLTVVATIDGVINFSQRIQRLERVRKLQTAIQRAGKPVYVKIKNKTTNLYQKSVDEIMNLLDD